MRQPLPICLRNLIVRGRAVRRAARQRGLRTFHVADGGVGVALKKSTYLAYPGSDVEIEVFNPEPGRAEGLVKAGKIAPIGRPITSEALPPA